MYFSGGGGGGGWEVLRLFRACGNFRGCHQNKLTTVFMINDGGSMEDCVCFLIQPVWPTNIVQSM